MSSTKLEESRDAITLRSLVNRKPREKVRDAIVALKVLRDLRPSRDFLIRFPGWGNLRSWVNSEPDELKQLLTEAEYRSARNVSNLNAFFTHPEIIAAMWSVVKLAGFTGGNVLEPGCGCGWFFLGMPAQLKKVSKLRGVEIDPIHARIAQALLPDAVIWNKSILDFYTKPDQLDLVIGNVPFDDGVFRKFAPDSKGKVALHAWVLARAATWLRPGGLICIVTSHGLLDGCGDDYHECRRWLNDRLELLGAVRLPCETFKAIGTEITPDLLLFRRR